MGRHGGRPSLEMTDPWFSLRRSCHQDRISRAFSFDPKTAL